MAEAPKPGDLAVCACRGIELGSYANSVALEPPVGWYSRTPVDVDSCIAAEVQGLWALGIKTVASCCGHGKVLPVISVAAEHEEAMLALGYQRQPEVGPGAFVPRFRRPDRGRHG